VLNTSSFGTSSGLGLPLVISGKFSCDACSFGQASDISFCTGDSLILESSNSNTGSFLWNTGETTNQIITKNPGQYICTNTFNDCEISDTFNVTVNTPKTFSLGSDTTVCNTHFITIQGPPDVEYLWSDRSTTRSISISSSGTYKLEIMDTNFCQSSDSIQVTFKQDEFKSIINDTLICDSTFELIFTTNYNSTIWNNTQTNDSFITDQIGTYWLEITDSSNCLLRDTFQVSLGLNPIFELDSFDFCRGDQISVTIPFEYDVQWYDGDTVRFKTFEGVGEFPYTLTSIDGCQESNSVFINQRNVSTELYIPNAFTPNEDNRNEQFPGFSSSTFLDNYLIQIFNRWGEKVYQSQEMNDWDGRFINMDCPQGVYVYLISFTDCNGNLNNLHGSVTLLR
jgi:gliding motility-associated-like protein